LKKEKLIDEIQEAFKNVKLNNGIGIFEADELDACSSEKKLQKAKEKDKSWWNDWKYIGDKHIAYYSSVMCFMDEKGIQWALPAYMIYAINNYENGSFSVDTTIYKIERINSNLNIFTSEQKYVITKFLKFMLEDAGEDWVDADFAQKALDNGWVEYQ